MKSEYTIHFYIAPFKFLMTLPKSSYRAQQKSICKIEPIRDILSNFELIALLHAFQKTLNVNINVLGLISRVCISLHTRIS